MGAAAGLLTPATVIRRPRYSARGLAIRPVLSPVYLTAGVPKLRCVAVAEPALPMDLDRTFAAKPLTAPRESASDRFTAALDAVLALGDLPENRTVAEMQEALVFYDDMRRGHRWARRWAFSLLRSLKAQARVERDPRVRAALCAVTRLVWLT